MGAWILPNCTRKIWTTSSAKRKATPLCEYGFLMARFNCLYYSKTLNFNLIQNHELNELKEFDIYSPVVPRIRY
jgi:hypothetical protein